jgi:hypothetical protein
MADQVISVEGSTFLLRRNVRKAPISAGQYAEKLSGAFSGYREALDELSKIEVSAPAETRGQVIGQALYANPKYRAALAWRDQADDFCRVASYVSGATTVDLPGGWPDASADVEPIRLAFVWLLDRPNVWDALDEAIKALELPNGLAGAPPEVVGTVASDSPLAVSATNGSASSN